MAAQEEPFTASKATQEQRREALSSSEAGRAELLQQLEARLEDSPRTVRDLCPPSAELRSASRLLEHLAATGRAIHEPHPEDPFEDRFHRL